MGVMQESKCGIVEGGKCRNRIESENKQKLLLNNHLHIPKTISAIPFHFYRVSI